MLKATETALRAIAQADPTINAAQINAALAELNGNGTREMQGEPPPRSYTAKQVATLLGRSLKAVQNYAKRGLLTPIYSGATGKRAQGYTGESVAALLSGKTTHAEGEGVANV